MWHVLKLNSPIMADRPGLPPGGLGGKLLGGLKAIGETIESTAKEAATKVASGVKDGVSVVGTGVISGVTAIKDSILDSELERLRSAQQFAKRQGTMPRRKQISEQELDEADRRADAVLQNLPQGYFSESFDPVRQELAALGDENATTQEAIDAVVDRLSQGVETVSGKLSRHVMKKREQLIQGIDTVATVEDDLKAALATTRAARSTTRLAGDEVQRHLRVAGQTRRKQSYMQLMDVIMKIKQARDLQKSLRRAQENGEYAEAILLCVQCFQGVDSLKDLSVSSELLATVQRLYVDTLQKLDGALTAICGEFDPLRYSKVLEGYMLQNVSGHTLAERVLQCFKDSINDVTLRVIKSLLLMQPKLVSQLAGSSSLEGSYSSLVRALPGEILRPALCQLMEVCTDVLVSFNTMALWHEEAVAQQRMAQAQAGADDEQAQTAARTTLTFLEAVSEMLSQSRAEVFQAAARRVFEPLKVAGIASGDGLLQVVEWCSRFLSLGECFAGCDLIPLRSAVGNLLSGAVEVFHHTNMEALSAMIQSETWRSVGGSEGSSCLKPGELTDLTQAVSASPIYTPGWSDPGGQRTFADWVSGGNPFSFASKAPTTTSGAKTIELTTNVMLTVSAQHVLKCIRTYALLLRPMGPARAATIWMAMTHLFDRLLIATYDRLSGISRAELVLQEDMATSRLRRVLLRMMTAEGSRYKQEIEELQQQRAAQLAAQNQAHAASGGTFSSWLDRVGNKVEMIASAAADKLSANVAKTLAESGLSTTSMGINEVQLGLQERVVGVEALVVVASELKAGKSAIVEALRSAAAAFLSMSQQQQQQQSAQSAGTFVPPQSAQPPVPIPVTSTSGPRLQYEGMNQILQQGQQQQQQQQQHVAAAAAATVEQPPQQAAPTSWFWAPVTASLPQEADAYFVRHVDAAQDLKECTLKRLTRSMLGRMLDPEHGITQAAATCPSYAIDDAAVMQQSQWAQETVRGLQHFAAGVAQAGAGLPDHVQHMMWFGALSLLADAITDGFSRVRRCTQMGRAVMGMDLGYIKDGLRRLLPPGAGGALEALQRPDEYVRAYYRPWDDFCMWARMNFSQYRLVRMLPLVDLVYEVSRERDKSKRMQLLAELQQLEAGLQ